MNTYELIDSLCEITSKQADIIRKQKAVIMQYGIEVEDPALDKLIEDVDAELDRVEMNMRKR